MAVPAGFPLSPCSSRASLRAFVSGTATTDYSVNAFTWANVVGANPYTATPVIPTGGISTEISAASDGIVLPAATINVLSTTGFATSGKILVMTAIGLASVTYSGVTTTSFTGCTGGSGLISRSGIVTVATTVPASGQSTLIYCETIRICNDGTNPITFTFDGTNAAGQVNPSEQVIYRNRREVGIAVAATVGTSAFRIEAW